MACGRASSAASRQPRRIAFGHHRCEAARQELGEKAAIDVVVRPLNDEQMLKFMGRENGEDYNADFLILLETYEAAERFLARESVKSRQTVDIARFLGWTRHHPQRNIDMANDAASACASASELLQGGYFKRTELAGLTVYDARQILDRSVSSLVHHVTQFASKVGKAGRFCPPAERSRGAVVTCPHAGLRRACLALANEWRCRRQLDALHGAQRGEAMRAMSR